MTGKEISDIVFTICIIGWIPIYFLFSGIAKVVSAFKENNTDDSDDNDKISVLKQNEKRNDEI